MISNIIRDAVYIPMDGGQYRVAGLYSRSPELMSHVIVDAHLVGPSMDEG